MGYIMPNNTSLTKKRKNQIAAAKAEAEKARYKLCGNKSLKSKSEDMKDMGKKSVLKVLGEGSYASACEINNKILRVVNINPFPSSKPTCDVKCLKNEFKNVKLMEEFNKLTENEYAPNIHTNYIGCEPSKKNEESEKNEFSFGIQAWERTGTDPDPNFSYSIQEKYDYDLFEYIINMDPDMDPDIDMVSQVIEIVGKIHENKIFHRDIKPEN